jgi:hypothetical protein
VEIIVKQDFSEADVKKADLIRSEFRKSKATSNVTNVLDDADSYRTVILCDDHVRAFAHPRVLSKYGYRQMTDFPFIRGNCNYCGLFTNCQVFSHESVFNDVWRTRDEQRRDAATATIVR